MVGLTEQLCQTANSAEYKNMHGEIIRVHPIYFIEVAESSFFCSENMDFLGGRALVSFCVHFPADGLVCI